MSESHLFAAHRLLEQAVAELAAAAGPGASDEELLSALTICEGVVRQVERVGAGAVASLERRGVFAARGYRSSVTALHDLLGCERVDARRRLLLAEQVFDRVALDGTALPPRLPATAAVFAAGGCNAGHVEVIARVLGSDAAGRLAPDVWAAVEEQLAMQTGAYSPTDLQSWGTELVEKLDQDGPEPDARPPALVNELYLTRNPSGAGGRIKGRIDDAAMFDAIATAVDAYARPVDSADERTIGERQAEALADVCGYVLDHGDVPACGGERPHLNVIVRLEDLENRARAGCLDFGGTLSPGSLRLLSCDARVVPIVMNGRGQPLDVGRATRVIPDGLRRAVAARDRGCARCGRPPSWAGVLFVTCRHGRRHARHQRKHPAVTQRCLRGDTTEAPSTSGPAGVTARLGRGGRPIGGEGGPRRTVSTQPVLDVYARLSKAHDGQTVQVDDQVELCTEKIAVRGGLVGEIFKDNSLSAWNPGVVRPDWNTLMARLESGASDGVMVYDLTRFSRKIMEGERLVDLAANGVRVWALAGEYDLATADGRRHFREAMVAAAGESDEISERVQRGKLRRARKGRHHGGPCPYGQPGLAPAPDGWEPGDPREPVPAERVAAERAVVRECYDRLLAGESVSALVRELNARGAAGDRAALPTSGRMRVAISGSQM